MSKIVYYISSFVYDNRQKNYFLKNINKLVNRIELITNLIILFIKFVILFRFKILIKIFLLYNINLSIN